MNINSKNLTLKTSKQGKGHYLPILEKTVEQLDAMLSYHCKILVVRLDLHVFIASIDNELISEFIRRFRSWANRQGHKRVGYIWCREQDKSQVQHYHCAFFLDANRNRHSHYIIQAVERLWGYWESGTVYTPNGCYYVVKRDDMAAYQQVFNRLSYLAKVDTKQKFQNTTNDYSTSRLKIKC